MENNKDNQGTAASKRDEKTVHPSNNSDRDLVNQTGKSQNMGNNSDYLTDPNNKANPETLAEGSEFLNDVIEENNPSREKETDTKEFYDHENTMTGNSNTGNSNTGNSSWSTGNSRTSNSGVSTSNSGTNVETDEDDDTQDPRGKVKSTMIDKDDNEDSADLDNVQTRRNT